MVISAVYLTPVSPFRAHWVHIVWEPGHFMPKRSLFFVQTDWSWSLAPMPRLVGCWV